MLNIDTSLNGKLALITGGTRGLGLAIALALGKQGASVVLTHRWGSADDQELRQAFADQGSSEPLIVEADVSSQDDTDRLMREIEARYAGVDIFVSNVCVAARSEGVAKLRKRDLLRSLEASAWPLSRYLDAIEARFSRLPQTTIAVSSDGPDHFYPGYDYVAFSKSALETSVALQAPRIARTGGRIFGLRCRQVATESLGAMFGPELTDFMTRQFTLFLMTAEAMGQLSVVLAGGLLDGMHGQVVCADRGASFIDNYVAVSELQRRLSLKNLAGKDFDRAVTT
jgi:NAD(P)-dependent dehydrogenase (short-subunit alcohol dehydrogenase family)